jgi:hypothetical protein
MERLAEQIVDWHNRHPLARRIRAGDVHTIGVVALPFVRTTAQTGSIVEPVLTDVVSAFDELHGSPPVSRFAVWLQRLRALPGQLLGKLRGRQPRTQWRAFNEKFLPGLSVGRIERFALAHGYTEAPAAQDARPWRVIVIDEKLAAQRGGWPFELYLMSAGIDVGTARTRVVSGRGIPSQIIGRRLWDLKRVAAAAAAAVVLLGVGAWLLWPRHAADPHADPAMPPPSAVASAAHAAASAPAAPASAAVPPADAASTAQPGAAASAAADMAEAASQPASGAEPAPTRTPNTPVPASELPRHGTAAIDGMPDIRPRLVERTDGIERPPLRSTKPAEAGPAGATTGPAATPTRTAPAGAATDSARSAEPADPRMTRLAETPPKSGSAPVALVGPAGSKADAEALLKKMKESLAGVHNNPEALQADVIQTPEGWRATVWPFTSREQAQLINATLVARGLKTKAVNF